MTLTDQQALELGRRAVAAVPIERWPDWTPVVDSENGDVGVLMTDDCGRFVSYTMWEGQEPTDDQIPLLNTPSGLGALLGLVREAHGPCCVMHDADDGMWWVVRASSGNLMDGIGVAHPTEAEALVAALEAAP